MRVQGTGHKHERNLKIVELLSNTEMTYKEIGDRFGISRARVHQIRKKYGLPGRQIQDHENNT